MGHGWEEAHWKADLPNTEWIDSISQHNPVLLYRMDVHMVLLNSVALRLAGIDADTAAPDGGKIVHGKHGEPTGILVYVPDACEEQQTCRIIPTVPGLKRFFRKQLGVHKTW